MEYVVSDSQDIIYAQQGKIFVIPIAVHIYILHHGICHFRLSKYHICAVFPS